MDLHKNIDEFILLISDIRNISPEDFAAYYPIKNKRWNPNNLSISEIENHFSSLQKFNISENWNGFISLTSKIYLIYEVFDKLPIEDKNIFINYFAIITKDAHFKTHSFVSDKTLSKKEYYNLLSIYQIFFDNLLFDVLNELKNLTHTSLVEPGATQDKGITPKPEFTFINNFDKVEPLKVFNYFKINLVDKKYLTIEQLENYLLLAFQDLDLTKEKFSFSNLHIGKVRTIFYKYFVDVANKPFGKKKEYANLLGGYFNSFTTEKVMNNFAEGY
ncbi:hypothetical protein [Algibacter pectinivorans]|uniref:Uncharacterized protein n=1 Tax=Algibacter pectinivorans TaxID=870482 RepID=A0A1I1NJW3_9FLAO|nr:hypothetical protein [Algibacter pectinivorans]SFC97716.1 hypothetical protein SAMN04487987_102351 [Algibacter pectinivorans]